MGMVGSNVPEWEEGRDSFLPMKIVDSIIRLSAHNVINPKGVEKGTVLQKEIVFLTN